MESQRFEVTDNELDSALLAAEQSIRVFCVDMRQQGLEEDAEIIESALNGNDLKKLRNWMQRTNSPYYLAVLEYLELQAQKYEQDGAFHISENRISVMGHPFDLNNQSFELEQAGVALQMQLRLAIEQGQFVEKAQELLAYFSQGNNGQCQLLNNFKHRNPQWPFHDAFERYICIKRPY